MCAALMRVVILPMIMTRFLRMIACMALLGLFAWFAWKDLMRWWHRQAAPLDESEVIRVGVGGMSCMNCVQRLESSLLDTEGVESARVQLEPVAAAT